MGLSGLWNRWDLFGNTICPNWTGGIFFANKFLQIPFNNERAMKTYLTTICAALLLFFSSGMAGETDSHGGHGDHKPDWTQHCTTLEDLGLSREQLDAISAVKERYQEGIMESYQACMLKKIKLRAMLRSSSSDEKKILELSKTHSEIRTELYERMIEYQIRIRAILTPDQRRNWCTMMGSSAFHSGW